MDRHLSEDEIAGLALGIASDDEAGRWRGHLPGCAECRQALERDRAVLAAVKEQAAPEVSASRWRRTMRSALDSTKAPLRKRPIPGRFNVDVILGSWGWRLAALALVFLLGYAMGSRRHTPRRPAGRPHVTTIIPAVEDHDKDRGNGRATVVSANATTGALSANDWAVSPDDAITALGFTLRL